MLGAKRAVCCTYEEDVLQVNLTAANYSQGHSGWATKLNKSDKFFSMCKRSHRHEEMAAKEL